ncbi:MAG: PAS domain S-box protein [Myxococcales bacterium]|nr:MAG: PAS domain S-box protein [Myxococcales bacterium]
MSAWRRGRPAATVEGSVLDEVVKVQPEALVSDLARRASSARAIAAVFMVMTLLASASSLAMTGPLMALPQFVACFAFGGAFWVARKPSRASFAGTLIVAAMLLQYLASFHFAVRAEQRLSIAYFVALSPLVAKATMRARGVVVCGVVGALTLTLMALLGTWKALVAPAYYFAATGLVAAFAAIAAERALRAHVREELRAAHALTGAREAEERYRLVAEQVSDLVSVLDDQGRYVYVSPSHERVLGLSGRDLLGRASPELLHADDLQGVTQAFSRALSEGASFTVARLASKDGSYRWFHIRFSRTEPNSALPGAVATSARDITEQQRLSQALEETRRMESLGRLAGGVAHDFNNLLLVIQACADLATRQLPPGHSARGDLNDILLTTDRAAALTKQLLTFARRQVLGVRRRSPVRTVVEELSPIIERLCGKEVRCTFELTSGSAQVSASSVELEQILMNLAANARDAMPQGGTLEVRARTLPLLGGDIAALPAGTYVELTVRDSGVGMSPEVEARIFEPFFTTKPPGRGTGLGLATVFGLVTQLGGHVAVSSRLGRGTEFRVLLPLAPEETTSSSVMRAARSVPRALSVLVVDDEDAVRTLISRILDDAGHRVTSAASADMAITAVRVTPQRFDVILTDVVLGADDGLSTLDTLRAANPDAAVIVMSGYSPTPERVAELAQQGAEFLPKPFGAVQLLNALERARGSEP